MWDLGPSHQQRQTQGVAARHSSESRQGSYGKYRRHPPLLGAEEPLFVS